MKPTPQYPKLLEQITRKTGDRPGEVFRRHLEMSFCALSYGQREAQYLTCISPIKNKPKVLELHANAFAQMVADYEKGAPFSDHLGDYHMELVSEKDAQARGEFYTPEPVVEMMTQMLNPSGAFDKTDGPITVHEPAAGSGRMVLKFAEHLVDSNLSPLCMFAEAWDVGVLPFWMCYINCTLWSIPARVIRGDTLRYEIYDEQLTPFVGMARAPRAEDGWTQRIAAMRQFLSGAEQETQDHEPEPERKPTLGKNAEQVSLF
jgi:hypothetical protein